MSQTILTKARATMFADLLQMQMAVSPKRVRGQRKVSIDLGAGLVFPMALRAKAAREWDNGDAALLVDAPGSLRFLLLYSAKQTKTYCLVMNAKHLPHTDQELLATEKASDLLKLTDATRAIFTSDGTSKKWKPAA